MYRWLCSVLSSCGAHAYLVYDPAGDAHAVEDGDVDDGGHSPVVDGLRAVGPHVGTLGQVDVVGREAE